MIKDWINSKSAYKRHLREQFAMNRIYEDETLALYYHRGAHTPPTIHKAVGYQKMHMLHEVWTYNPITKRFQAFKNRGLGQELVELMAQSGITLRSSAARISDAATMELRFDTDKDRFLFKLKYGYE